MTLNPQQFGTQLSMFEPAHKVLAMRLGDQRNETKEQLMDANLDDAWGSGLYHDIDREGVKQPLAVGWSGMDSHLFEGHHRLAVALDQDPDTELPLTHFDVRHGYPAH